MVRRLEIATVQTERLDSVVRSVRAVNQHITRETNRRVLAQKSCETLVRGLGYRKVEIKLDGALMGRADLYDGSRETHDETLKPQAAARPMPTRMLRASSTSPASSGVLSKARPIPDR